MTWTALVPLKAAGVRKQRLAARLDADARDRLAEAMLAHVAAMLAALPEIVRMVLLVPVPPGAWPGEWIADRGRGLNAELTAARAMLAVPRLLVLHADLPLLDPPELRALLAAAGTGAAIAPDRHDRGTNALAGWRQDFAFGEDSFARHRAMAPQAAIVRRRGLASDLDTPDDLDAAAA